MIRNNYWNLYVPKSELMSNNKDYVGIPRVNDDGVMEIGEYIDFHKVGTSTDYTVRMRTTANEKLEVVGDFVSRKLLPDFGNTEIGSMATNIFGVKTNKNILFTSGRQKNVLGANVYNDSVNDIHYDKTLGASQIILDANNYPKYRWSNQGSEQYGIAQWSPYYEILTNHSGQQVMTVRSTITNDTNWNTIDVSGVYTVSNAGSSANKPPNSYYYGTLLAFRGQGSLSQIYLPHSGSHSMQYRTYFYSGSSSWTNWANVGWSERMASTLEEDVNIYEDKINALEKRIMALEAIVNKGVALV